MCSFNIFNPSQHDIRKVWIGVEQLQTIPLYACTVQYPKTVPTYTLPLYRTAPQNHTPKQSHLLYIPEKGGIFS
jgi:hypothetical protein